MSYDVLKYHLVHFSAVLGPIGLRFLRFKVFKKFLNIFLSYICCGRDDKQCMIICLESELRAIGMMMRLMGGNDKWVSQTG